VVPGKVRSSNQAPKTDLKLFSIQLGSKAKPYVPDFRTAFDHFCIHPGGKAVIETVGKELRLNKQQCQPMLMPFERYGNTSSCSTW
jgi:3-ketoacyl-CoA synthase